MQGHQRRDGLHALGLCTAVIASVLLLDYVLDQRDLAANRSVAPIGLDAAGALTSTSIPDVVITGFQFLHSVPKPDASPLWQLTAKKAMLFEQKQEATMLSIQAVFQPTKAGASGGELDGGEGHLDLGQMNFNVTGGEHPVTVRLAKRYTLTTSRLQWDNESARLTTDEPVTITGEGLAVTAQGFQWLQADGTISLLRNVHTVVAQ
jgi:LPS export ABC transporter protein LptC